jgi:tRNA modification GTPase
LAFHLRVAIREIGSITGIIDNEEVLGSIFSRFCIGK